MKHPFVKQDGIVNGINFDGRFSVSFYPGIAFYLLGYSAEQHVDEDGEVENIMDNENVVAVMVGDDRRHIVHVSDLKEIAEEDYCPSCGQIGCGHGRA